MDLIFIELTEMIYLSASLPKLTDPTTGAVGTYQ